MNKIKYIISALIILTVTVFSQSATLKGKIYDQDNNQPLNAASVTLHSQADSSMITGAASDAKGNFVLNNIRQGNYYLRVSYIGYQTVTLPSVIVDKPGEKDLGEIKISSKAVNIGDVLVTGEKQQFEYNFDKKVINVDKDLTAVGGTVLDILKNTPSIQVDQDNNITLRGKSNIKILIDGKPRPFTDAGTLLEMIPASQIDRIEIITNPSARYDAEGDTGIINIITKKEEKSGFNTIASLTAGTGDKYGGSLNLNYNIGALNLYSSYNVRSDRRTMNMNQYRETYFTDTTSFLDQRMNRGMGIKVHSVSLGMDYALSATDKFNFSGDYRYHDREVGGLLNSAQYTRFNNLPSYYNKINDAANDYGYELRAGYMKEFRGKDHELLVDAYYGYDTDKDINNTFVQYYDLQSNPLNPVLWETETGEKNHSGTLQIDYINSIIGGPKIEGGYKLEFRNNDDRYSYFNFPSVSAGRIEDPTKANNFLYERMVHSLYALYSDSLGALRYQLGFRVENTYLSGDQQNINKKFERNFTDYFPTLNMNYMFDESRGVYFNYSRRINRPNGRQLNPFVEVVDSTIIRYGNPELNPEYADAYELGFDNFFDFGDVSVAGFYRKSVDQIQMYRTLNTNGVFENTFLNFAVGENYGLEFLYNLNFVRWLRINGDVSYFKTTVEGNAGLTKISNFNYSWAGRINSSIILPEAFFIQLMAVYRGPSATPQGTRFEMYWMDLAFRKDFFNGKLSLNLRFSDVFNTMKFKSDSREATFFATNEFIRESQVITLGITWRLDSTQKQPDKKRPNNENGGGDDMMF